MTLPLVSAELQLKLAIRVGRDKNLPSSILGVPSDLAIQLS
jgi:hypothetical protein